ncbi:sulfotransferase family protein [Streptomyces sp. NPDC059639]|uniref:sulfotransferase family protein n=1 Tax=Streptomyces sp. NPDC059639 TaxID=3346891 RepID=UPI003692456F
MGTVQTGIRRRARLLKEALSAPAPRAGGPAAPPARRPPKRTVPLEVAVPRAPRLVESPVFVLTPVRAGSTLLRMLLNSHSRVRAPHELHLRSVEVDLAPDFSGRALRALDLDKAELEHVLWDRVLHLELERSGKDVVVDKTPGNVWAWQRLEHAWPRARFLFLRRHPRGIVDSLDSRKGNTATTAENERNVLKYLDPLEEARRRLDPARTHTVRYEDLTADPAAVTRGITDWLGVDWEPGMLDYGSHADEHGPLLANLGDRSEKILSGRVQATPAPPTLDGLSPRVREVAENWGYGHGFAA